VKLTRIVAAASIIAVSAMLATNVLAKERNTGRGTGPVVYVTSQGLFYDSIVVADLPAHGRFQLLEVVGGNLHTEFGPGNVGYLGGRWWMDANGDGEMNAGDAFFLCPLLGPGRTTP